jgi:hypothetical protein
MRVDTYSGRRVNVDSARTRASTPRTTLLPWPTSPTLSLEWPARMAIVLFACAMAWHTWAHWGDFQIDNGRELYVPAEILKGKLLFRDLWYMYGPLAPYLKALLFRIFGVHLTVLYGLGLTLTVGTALLIFEIARFSGLGLIGSLLPSAFFLTESFYPFIRNFVFPYSYAASLGTFLGLACLYFVLRHISSQRDSHLASASVLCSLVVLTKQETGFACVVLLAATIVASDLVRHSQRVLLRRVAICLAALFPAVAVYAWFIAKVSAHTLFIENWVSTPGTYFMRTFSKTTMAEQGFRFVPSELLQAAAFSALGLLLWGLMAFLSAFAVKKWGLQSRWSIATASLIVLLPLWFGAVAFVVMFPYGVVRFPNDFTRFVVLPLTEGIFPKGIFLIVFGFLLNVAWDLRKKPRETAVLQKAALSSFAVLLGMRQMMELRPNLFLCAVYFNVPAFLVFVLVVVQVIRYFCRSLDAQRQNTIIASFLFAETVFLFLLFQPRPDMLPAKFTSEYGSLYTASDAAKLLPQLVDFMKTHTKNGKDILMLPEPPSLYVFSGTEAPTKWYSLVPGELDPVQEPEFIRQAEASQVRYVLISDRSFNEYGVRGFINRGYSHGIYSWIMANFTKVQQFGPLRDAPYPPYIVWVFERNDLARAQRVQPAAAASSPPGETSQPIVHLTSP